MTSVVFMGSPDFAVPVLYSVAENFKVAGVVTQPDKPAGRGRSFRQSPVKAAAMDLGIEILQPEKLLSNRAAIDQIKHWNPAIIIVAAYGKVLRQEILSIPEFGCINLHASLLPRWRGASPIQAAILHGDEFTGTTVMKMDEGLDTGPILNQRATAILPQDTAGSLENRLSAMGADLLVETLLLYLAGKIDPIPQSEHGVTYAPLLKKEDGRLDFSQPAKFLARQVRAYNPWPGSFTLVDGGVFKVHKSDPKIGQAPEPGKMMIIDDYPAISTCDGCLVLTEVQPSGKKSMDGKSFLMGYRNWDHFVN